MKYEYLTKPENHLLVLTALMAAGWNYHGITDPFKAYKEYGEYKALTLFPGGKSIAGNQDITGGGKIPLDDKGLVALISGKTPETTVRLNNEYTAVISSDKKTIKVGCQTFDRDVILKVAEALK